jgi:hypothetical protein
MHADTYSSSQDLLHKYDVISEGHHPKDLLRTCKLPNKFCNFRECSRQTELYFSLLSLKLYIGSSKIKTLKICLWNLSYVKQACKHTCMCVCASNGNPPLDIVIIPTACLLQQWFKAFLTIYPPTWVCKKFIYLSIHRRPWNLSPSWNFSYVKHTQTHALVCHGKSASCNAHTHLYAMENQWVIVTPTASSCLLQQLQSKKNCSLYPPTCDCNKFLSECREVYPLNIYLSDLLKSQLCCWKMHNTKCAIEVESITSINKLLTHSCKQASGFEVP